MKAAKDGKVARKGLLQDRLQQALDAGVLTEQEVEKITAQMILDRVEFMEGMS